MNCPFCNSDQIVVKNSRPSRKDTQIWRRRQCLKCKGVFTTREKMTASFIIVEKKDGHHMQFAHSKLFASIYRALIENKNNDFGSSANVAQDLTQKIEELLIYKKIKLIKTKDLCKLTFEIMAKNHPSAAIRYFIYFNNFSSVAEYLRQIKKYLLPK